MCPAGRRKCANRKASAEKLPVLRRFASCVPRAPPAAMRSHAAAVPAALLVAHVILAVTGAVAQRFSQPLAGVASCDAADDDRSALLAVCALSLCRMRSTTLRAERSGDASARGAESHSHKCCRPSCVPALWLHVNVTWATPKWAAAWQLTAGARPGVQPRRVTRPWELTRQCAHSHRHSACRRHRHRVDGDFRHRGAL